MPRIQYDRKSWTIDGKRTFLLSAAIHYFRLPAAEWAEVLDKTKLAGCNCVETYIPWNWHEPEEGVWEFGGDKDLSAFLAMCAERELYVILRPGPYICAEWDMGGLPYWLAGKPDMVYRSFNRPYLHYVDLYFDRLVPYVKPHLLTQGGTVIMVQVENEFQALGKPDKAYMEYLRDGLISRGIDVPLVTCYGAVDGAVEFRNFWSHAEEHASVLDQRFDDQPKGVLEFWIGWFEQWGGARANQKTAAHVERMTYELLREGFTAINYYMFFGGTNFDHWGGRTIGEHTFMTTSYDYDAPLDEYLRPTPKYKALRRVHSFVSWLEPLLTDSADAVPAPAPAKRLIAKKKSGAAGTILFLASEDNERLIGRLNPAYAGLGGSPDQPAVPFTVEAGAMLPVVSGVKIGKAAGAPIVLELLTAYTTGFADGVGTVYHETGQQSSLTLSLGGLDGVEVHCPLPQQARVLDNGSLQFTLTHGSEPQTITLLHEGMVIAAITVVDRLTVEAQADREAAAALAAADAKRAANPGAGAAHESAAADTGASQGAAVHAGAAQVGAPALSGWAQASGQADFGAPQAVFGDKPLDFTAYGQFSGFLAYASDVESNAAADRTLLFPRIEEPARVFVNGRYAGQTTEIGAASLPVSLQPGVNRIEVIVQNMGRYNFTQTLAEPKGLGAAPSLGGETLDLMGGWQVEGTGRAHRLDAIPGIEGRIGFYRAFENSGQYDGGVLVGFGLSRLRLNGRALDVHLQNDTAWNRLDAPYAVADISAALQPGRNEFEMDVQGLDSLPKMKLYLFKTADQITGWHTTKAADFEAAKAWTPVVSAAAPRWYKAAFAWTAGYGGPEAKLQVRLDGMAKGALWVNGVCLGRYWQNGSQEAYKIPVSLLQPHNELILFDEIGSSPERVALRIVV